MESGKHTEHNSITLTKSRIRLDENLRVRKQYLWHALDCSYNWVWNVTIVWTPVLLTELKSLMNLVGETFVIQGRRC